jgi:hypothetical protein
MILDSFLKLIKRHEFHLIPLEAAKKGLCVPKAPEELLVRGVLSRILSCAHSSAPLCVVFRNRARWNRERNRKITFLVERFESNFFGRAILLNHERLL